MTDQPKLATAGVIFDLDGTLVDNMELHAEAFNVFTDRHGLPRLDAAMRKRIDGKRNRDIFPILFDDPLDPETIRSHTIEKESLYRELSRAKLAPIAGLEDFLAFLTAKVIPFAIATSAPAENVVHSLRELGLTETFSTIVRGDEVPRGKPFPDVFLKAAELLQVAPQEALVFEDAPAGVQAGLAANMRCAALTTSFAQSTFLESVQPHHFLEDYKEVLESPAKFGLA